MSCLRLALPAILVLSTVSGCGSARLIQSGPDGGIVAIPSNSNSWPNKYRDEAEKLMAQKCPNGYEIVEEKEVPTGQRTTTSGGSITPIGYKDNTTATTVVTSTHTETEFRITFKARPILPVPTTQIKPMPAPTPVLQPVPEMPPGLPPRPIPVNP